MPKDRRVNIEGPGIHRFPRAENCRHESGIANSALSPIHAGGAEKFGTLFPTLSRNLSPRLGRSSGLLSSSRRGDLLFGVRVFFAWRPVWSELPPPGRSGKKGRSWVSNTCRTDFEWFWDCACENLGILAWQVGVWCQKRVSPNLRVELPTRANLGKKGRQNVHQIETRVHECP